MYGCNGNQIVHAMRSLLRSLPLAVLAICFSQPTVAQMAVTSNAFDIRANQSGMEQMVRMGNAYDVVSITIDAAITDQIAEVSVTQRIHNPNNTALEVEIFFPLPNGGTVSDFVMMIDQQEVPGELMARDKARSIYEGIVRQKKDPALMEYVGYGLFKTSVFPMAIGEERDISIRYTQVLERKLDLISFAYPLGTQKFSRNALRNVSFNARIRSSDEIKNVFSPSYTMDIDRRTDQSARVSFDQQGLLPDRDIQLSFSLGSGAVGATLLSYKPEADENGYFMLMASPEVAEDAAATSAKSVVFVLDRSGSMAGKKLEGAKQALEFVLGNLNEEDMFNLVVYDDRVQTFRPEMQCYSKHTYNDAMTFVHRISSGGGTNINSALTTAMGQLTDDERPNYVIFLTDGLASTGITNEMDIARNVKAANKGNARVFSFGVGNDVNTRLLDRISADNGGSSEFLKPFDDVETKVAALYNNISSPAMTDIEVVIDRTDVMDTYPEQLPDLFKGGQLLWVGRYTKPGSSKICISGKINGEQKTVVVEARFADVRDGADHSYLSQLWATRRVGHLVDQIDLHGKSPERVQELVTLSKEYGILTPFTAFLAREDQPIDLISQDFSRAEDELESLAVVQGSHANAMRNTKQKMKRADGAVASDIGWMADSDFMNGDVAQNVRKIGEKTFYLRNGNWVDASVSAEEAERAQNIEPYSDEYFNIASANVATMNQYLNFSENVIVRMNGAVYNITY